jgi:hypothetical protein
VVQEEVQWGLWQPIPPFHCFSSRDWRMLLFSLDFNIFLFFNFSLFTFNFSEKNEESQQYLEKLTIKLMSG